MFNEAYSSGKVPIQWQTALIDDITPILKHGDASDPANYRWGALVQAICKYSHHRLTQYTEQQQLRTHTHKLDIDLTSVLFIKYLFCNMSLTSKSMHMNHCTSVL